MRHRYPFEALHWLRKQRVDRQAGVLSESAQAAARALREAEHAESARRSTEQDIAALAATEQARLDDGLVRVSDLQTIADWQKGADAELALKAERERRAREAQASAAAVEARARRALATASNEAKLLDAHRDAFRTQCAVARELSEEEAANEQWTASHFSSRRG